MPGVLLPNPQLAACQVFAQQILTCCNVPQRNETWGEFNKTFPACIREVVQRFAQIEETDSLRNRIAEILSQRTPYASIRAIRELAQDVFRGDRLEEVGVRNPQRIAREHDQRRSERSPANVSETEENDSNSPDASRERNHVHVLREEYNPNDETTTLYFSVEQLRLSDP